MTTLQDEFEAHLKAMPDWAPEFEVHRPWVEKLLLDAWNAATERAAKLVESGPPPFKIEGGRVEIGEMARNAFASAIRARDGKGEM